MSKQDPVMNRLAGHSLEPVSMKDQAQRLTDYLPADAMSDVYGVGEYIEGFEQQMASLFEFDRAVFMPSGTMAQQIALRIWCDQQGNQTVAMHPSAHLETAEQLGYQFLHDLKRVQFGVPELIHHRLLTPKDFQQLATIPAVVLLELPARPLGGQLPTWDELLEIRSWCDDHDVAMHMDGARIWSAPAFYGKSLAEISSLFDSVYVSFYKDLGGLCGCMLLGSESFIAESQVWQRRHGGNLYNQFPFVASAKHGFETRLPQMDSWVSRAKEIAALMNEVEGIQTNPEVPHSNIFQVFLRGQPESLQAQHVELSKSTGTHLFSNMNPAPMPGYSMTEVHCWENAMAFDESGLIEFLQKLVSE